MVMNPIDNGLSGHIPRVFVPCDRSATMPLRGYVLQQQGLRIRLGTHAQKAADIVAAKRDPLTLSKKTRFMSAAPTPLFLPAPWTFQSASNFSQLLFPCPNRGKQVDAIKITVLNMIFLQLKQLSCTDSNPSTLPGVMPVVLKEIQACTKKI